MADEEILQDLQMLGYTPETVMLLQQLGPLRRPPTTERRAFSGSTRWSSPRAVA